MYLIAAEFIDQVQWSYDCYGPCVVVSEPAYRNNLRLWLEKYHPSLVRYEMDILGTVRKMWPIVKVEGTNLYEFRERFEHGVD
jgi:hypothetical protein